MTPKLDMVGAVRMAVAATVLACAATTGAQAQDNRLDDEPTMNVVATSKITSVLDVNGKRQSVSGRVSLSLVATDKQLDEGIVTVRGFNVVYLDADQQLISGAKVEGPTEGVLGFAVRNDGIAQELDYDRAKGRLSGELFGTVDAQFMAPMAGPRNDVKGEGDNFETPTQPATLRVEMQLDEGFLSHAEQSGQRSEVQRVRAAARFDLQVDENLAHGLDQRYQLVATDLWLELEISWFFEAAQQLCVQPVRIGRITVSDWGGWPFSRPIFSVDYTGSGLGFGLPGARREWAKADIVFNVRPFRKVWNSSYFEMDTNGGFTSTEEAALHAEVTDADCIEVFFVENNVPVDAHGGGATWGSGTATSQIITSDGNAVGGIDLTHLAHELGHVLDLPHPDGSPGVSTGTLMCPSGWMNDNPAVNSEENEDNVSNPLLTFIFKVASAGPDCANSADCGAC